MSMNQENEVPIRLPGIIEGSELEQKLAENLKIQAAVPPPPSQEKGAGHPGYYRRPLAYVSNFMSHTVSMIEIPTKSKILDIPVGSYPYGITISPDRRFVYVSNMGDESLSVISTRINQVVHTINLNTDSFTAARPNGVKVSPDGRWIYVVNETTHNISVVDAIHKQVVTEVSLPNGSAPLELDITADGRLAFVTLSDYETKKVAVVDLKVNLPLKYIDVGRIPIGIAVARRNTLALAANSNSYTLSAINTIIAEASPNDIDLDRGVPWHVVFNFCENIAYVSNYAADYVEVVDVFSHLQIGTITVEQLPKGMALTADGRFLVVCNSGSNTVSIIDTRISESIATVPAGVWPQYAAILN